MRNGAVAGWRLARKSAQRKKEGHDAHLRAQPHSEESLYEQLYRALRFDIESGALGAGGRLPSKRAFAKHLGVSVVTVEGAYDQLVAEGYVRAVPRSGFYVQEIGPNLASFSEDFDIRRVKSSWGQFWQSASCEARRRISGNDGGVSSKLLKRRPLLAAHSEEGLAGFLQQRVHRG